MARAYEDVELIPTRNEFAAANRDGCARVDHPPRTYNPWDDRTWCWCGVRRYAGNVAPPHPPLPAGHSWLNGWPPLVKPWEAS